MTSEEVSDVLNDPGWQNTVFESLWQTYVVPNVHARQKIGDLIDPIELHAVHVILCPDGTTKIRVNDEVQITVEPVLEDNAELEVGKTYELSQFSRLRNLLPDGDVDQNCGYIVLLRINGGWQGAFSFIYNKEYAQRYLAVSREFLVTARDAAGKGFWSAAFDCLFSAAELAISTLLSSSSLNSVQSRSHQELTLSFEKYAQHGNVDPDILATFQYLSSVRKLARYPHKPTVLDNSAFQQHLDNVEKLFEQAKEYASISLESKT